MPPATPASPFPANQPSPAPQISSDQEGADSWPRSVLEGLSHGRRKQNLLREVREQAIRDELVALRPRGRLVVPFVLTPAPKPGNAK